MSAIPLPQQALETVRVAGDDTRIERSCRLELAPGVLRDARGDGVIQIAGDGITVELAGELRGAAQGEAPDTFAGVGIRVTGKDVVLRGARVSGYKVGIHAEGADGLVVEDCDVSGNFRQRLKSTEEKEAGEDWVDPHHNDQRQWFQLYGAGIFAERSSGITVRRSRARAGQNGLVLDRCDKAQVYDNDLSFLSGWGIALWRSSDCVISKNACDFCIRGYVHGVYNRGQDSAGILLFEQCSRNVIAENSATHCGDGFFGFAGQEAVGGVAAPSPEFDYRGRGCNENKIFGNDFSYAAAHGLEITFSFDNEIRHNRLAGNSICGLWAGYSRNTRIIANLFEANGSSGYGLERGGVNIEHGQRILIEQNRFLGNECGVHLWWDADEHLVELAWCKANGHESLDNVVQENLFQGDKLAIQLRAAPGTRLVQNVYEGVGTRLDATDDSFARDEPRHLETKPGGHAGLPGRSTTLPGAGTPVGGRAHLAGRDKIVIDEWGPIEPR